MNFLNVGGCNKHIPVPPHYNGWDHKLLDIVPNEEVDVVCDAREMKEKLPASQFDAVYCAHNLEHFHPYDAPKVLEGFKHVVKDDGFIEIRVPNLKKLFETLVKEGKDLDAVMYESAAGPIRAIDMIYGKASFIEASGSDFMCHKNGFSNKSLAELLFFNGFEHIFMGEYAYELLVFAFKNPPTEAHRELLKLKGTTV